MRIVIDCNVLVSAALTDGVCRLAVAEAIGNHDILLSEDILDEYREVADRPKFPPAVQSRMHALIEKVAAQASVVAFDRSVPAPDIADVDDAVYVIVAITSPADAIVTGNTAHFTAPSYGRALVVSPREFLDMVGA
ncbi:putative toxin-antitoxin system toxin component, PIN family [Azospirillum sp. ST 5-10]|uniref:putative toxin-antitoxin system toxin component, PIN family n=1 Tax=unclassified Azospirillum TaxID=2630922 RepID=UPI003F4A2B4B